MGKWAIDKLFQIPDDIFECKGNNTDLELHVKYQQYYESKQISERYVQRGSILTCNKGSELSRLNLLSDHGTDQAVATISDCVAGSNISDFDLCSCKSGQCDSKCKPVLSSRWIQGGNDTVKIWNEINQDYEGILKETAMLPCFLGGMITIKEVFQKEAEILPQTLFCIHGKKFAFVDTSHPAAPQVLSESVVLADIEALEIPKAAFSLSSITLDETMGNAEVDLTSKDEAEKDRLQAIEDEEDPLKKQRLITNYIADKIAELRAEGKVPEHNEVTSLAEKYFRAGGDLPGLLIATVWVLGLAPDASKDILDDLRQQNEIKTDEIIGEMELDTNSWFDQVLASFFGDDLLSRVNWKDYMKKNPILLGKVGDVVIPIGQNLVKGKNININMNFSMIIENGDGYTGYEFLHGVHMLVGGFHIEGKIKKSYAGNVTYDLTYTWNDIINPEIERYSTDRDRNEIAVANFTPKDYIIRIKWSDKSIRKAKVKTRNHHSGWLKDWWSIWEERLSDAYAERYYYSEAEQVQYNNTWPEVLAKIKSEYSDYYN